ncbi:dynein intermediate chain 2, ciliary-like [Procambarus clarkii]|uniref:dynein intermediate chain 2, ciliary-like n=1 Tax=Procambarus clarkii TaxID=6728 RepID=UPI00374482F4
MQLLVTEEPEVRIPLSTSSARPRREVRVNHMIGRYEPVRGGDCLIHLLTLPSRITSVGDRLHHSHHTATHTLAPPQEQDATILQELEDLYGGLISPQQLALLDHQANPFNFSERVSQTLRPHTAVNTEHMCRGTELYVCVGSVVQHMSKCLSSLLQEVGIQTEPRPSTTFGATVGFSNVHDAYRLHQQALAASRKQQKLFPHKKDNKDGGKQAAVVVLQSEAGPAGRRVGSASPQLTTRARREGSLATILPLVKVIERMISQNIYHDVIQDFQYWEDWSDDYRSVEGSLLPLWRFNYHKARTLTVADVCWSPAYPDLFVAAYTNGEERPEIGREGVDGEAGVVCVYTLKNPVFPERVIHTPTNVTSVHFHPTRECVLASGLVDGTVMYIDGRLSQAPQVLTSVATDGKHLLPVSQVRWGPAEAGRMPYFYSASADGRVSEWAVRPSTLDHTDILDFYHCPPHRSRHFTTATLRGTATCLAVNPREGSVVLVGVDTGVVLQLNTTTTLHHLTQYPAHTAPVRAVAWNTFHHRVFATCSLDWMIKIWLQYHTSPLIVLDLGAPVTGLAWSSSSSTVVVGVTDEGRVHVYDLFVRRCRPACVQSVLQRRRSALSCVAFSPFHHIIVVGGERGYLLTLKLSPNLRRVHRTSGEQTPREAQVHLLDSIIATTRGPHAPPRP